MVASRSTRRKADQPTHPVTCHAPSLLFASIDPPQSRSADTKLPIFNLQFSIESIDPPRVLEGVGRGSDIGNQAAGLGAMVACCDVDANALRSRKQREPYAVA